MSVKTYRFRRPRLYAKQEEAIYSGRRYAIIEASTKSGKTVGCLAWITEQAWLHGFPNWNGWWVAPVYPQAEIAFRRLKRFLPAHTYVHNNTKLTITLLHNGATIWFKSAEKPDNLYGEDVYAAVIDEATRCREESWHAVRSTLTATRGPVRIIGNVKGRKNWVYAMARSAEAGDPDMSFMKITAMDAVEGGVLAAEEIEDAKRRLPEEVFRELYLAEASEDGANPFGMKHIADAVMTPGEWALAQQTYPRAWGWDLAKRADWTVGIALGSAGRVVRFNRWRATWEHTLQRINGAIDDDTPCAVDQTGVGDPIVERLQQRWSSVYGFTFTAGSRQMVLERLAVAIQHGEVRIPDGPIRAELEAFEYEVTRTMVRYSSPIHDDCVMALALAVDAAQRVAAGPSIGGTMVAL